MIAAADNKKSNKLFDFLYDLGLMILVSFSVAGSFLLIMDPPNIVSIVLASINLLFIITFMFIPTMKMMIDEVKRRG